MTFRSLRLLSATIVGLAGASSRAASQSIFDTSVRTAPQFLQYRISAPVSETISEFTTPIFVVIPVSSTLNFDVATAYASARVRPNGNNPEQPSSISGLTDTQIRANVLFGTDFVVLTAGLNIPTGKETANDIEQLAAFRIGNDFLAFPISNMGTGFGATAGIAVARPLGAWNIGLGGSLRQSAAYDPVVGSSGARPRFQPGDEYRARFCVDHPFGTGRFAVGLTYSKFGNDNIGGSIYNTGDRYVTQAGFNNSFGSANVLVNAWDLYRRPGAIFTGERTGPENIASILVGVGVSVMSGVLEPSLEFRNWTQESLSASRIGALGLRYTVQAGGLGITPSAGYTVGRLGAVEGNADLRGFRAAIAVRLGARD